MRFKKTDLYIVGGIVAAVWMFTLATANRTESKNFRPIEAQAELPPRDEHQHFTFNFQDTGELIDSKSVVQAQRVISVPVTSGLRRELPTEIRPQVPPATPDPCGTLCQASCHVRTVYRADDRFDLESGFKASSSAGCTTDSRANLTTVAPAVDRVDLTSDLRASSSAVCTTDFKANLTTAAPADNRVDLANDFRISS